MEKMKTISPLFSDEEVKKIRIKSAHAGVSMRVWIREEILKLISKEDGK